MRALRIGVLAVFITGLLGGAVRAQEAAVQAAAADPAQAPAQDAVTEPADGAAQDKVTGKVKIAGRVVEVRPAQGEGPTVLVLDVGGKQIEVPVPGDAKELAGIVAGSFVKIKGTTEAVTKVKVEKEADDPEFKGVLTAVSAGQDGATVTLRVGGQDITFSAADLGLTPELLAKFKPGDRIKIEGDDSGAVQVELDGAAAKLEVTIEGDQVKAELKEPEAQIAGKVVEVRPGQAGTPAVLVLDVGGKQIEVPVPGDAKGLAAIAAGSFVEVKATADAVTEIEVQDELDDPELDGVLTAVSAGQDGATVTLRIGGQDITFSAADLGLTPELLARFKAGDRIQIEGSESGAVEIELASDAAKAEVTIKGDELKVEFKEKKDDEKDDETNQKDEKKGHEDEEEDEKGHKEGKKKAKEDKEDKDDEEDDDEEKDGKEGKAHGREKPSDGHSAGHSDEDEDDD